MSNICVSSYPFILNLDLSELASCLAFRFSDLNFRIPKALARDYSAIPNFFSRRLRFSRSPRATNMSPT